MFPAVIPGLFTDFLDLFKVMVSDGINSRHDTSDGIFEVSRHEPEAYILAPADDIRIHYRQTVLLRGSAFDLEDGILPCETLEWMSSLSGSMGYRYQLTLADPPFGEHTISLEIIDSDNNMTTSYISLYIGAQIYLPVVMR